MLILFNKLRAKARIKKGARTRTRERPLDTMRTPISRRDSYRPAENFFRGINNGGILHRNAALSDSSRISSYLTTFQET
jgi:hypothetical protein